MTQPALLDKTKPFGTVRGEAPYAFTQKVEGILFGFDREGFFCYDPREDPAAKVQQESKIERNLPAQFKDKPLDESRPYSTVRGYNISYVYMQDHLGFDANKKAVYADPGYWGVPKPEEEVAKKETKPTPDEPPVDEQLGEISFPGTQDDKIYPLDYLRSLSAQELKALWFRHDMGDWKGVRGKPAALKAIEELSKLTGQDA